LSSESVEKNSVGSTVKSIYIDTCEWSQKQCSTKQLRSIFTVLHQFYIVAPKFWGCMNLFFAEVVAS